MYQPTSYSDRLTFFQKIRSLDYWLITCILTLGIILLISGGIMIYCYRRLNVLENGLIQQGRAWQTHSA